MANLDSHKIKEIGLFKYYRLVRKWACKTYDLKDADLELLIYLDSLKRFNRQDFIDGTYAYSWDKLRWNRLRKNGWIDVWRSSDRKASKYNIYKTSFRAQNMIMRIYRILLGEEDLPTSVRSAYYRNSTYTERVMNKRIDDMINDPDR